MLNFFERKVNSNTKKFWQLEQLRPVLSLYFYSFLKNPVKFEDHNKNPKGNVFGQRLSSS